MPMPRRKRRAQPKPRRNDAPAIEQPNGAPSLEDEGLIYPGTSQAEGERRPEDDRARPPRPGAAPPTHDRV